MSGKPTQLNEDHRLLDEQESELLRHVIDFCRELKRQREMLAGIPEDVWKRLAQHTSDEQGKRQTHWPSLLALCEEAELLSEQMRRQLAPLHRAGLLDRDLTDDELADVLIEPTDNQFEQSDEDLYAHLNFYLTDKQK